MLSRLTTLALLPARLLTAALQHLTPTSARSPAPAAPECSPAAAATRALPRAGRGKYDEPLLMLVDATPGITVAQAAEHLGVPATALYPTIRRLEPHVERGRELHPAA